MGKYETRLRAELHREFNSQVVDTPPPHRARYGQLERSSRRLMPLRTVALVTAVFAIGVLVGLVYNSRFSGQLGPGHQLGATPAESPTASPTASPTTGATQPSLPASTPKVVRRPSAPASAPASRPAFADDFAADPVGANLPSGWHAGDGQWDGVVNSGGTHQLRHSAAAGASHLWAGSAQWSDYSVSADVTTGLLGLGFAGVSGRYQDPANGYECGVGLGSQLQLWLVKDGVRTLLGASGVSLDLTAHHAVALDLRGGRLTCSLDGAPLVHATDSTFGSGRFALVTSAGEAAEFGNVRVSG